jgi:uncharacterized protein (TIGR02996 family)
MTIPDLNLRLALASALAREKLLPAFEFAKLQKKHPPSKEDLEDLDEDSDDDDDGPNGRAAYVYNSNLAEHLAATKLPDAKLAKLRDVHWTDDKTMFAIWPQFDGESGEFFIDDLRGLERCAGLTRLAIYEGGAGKITSLKPIAGLKKLRELNLNAPLTDLSPLAGLAALENLSLSGLSTTDVRPIAGLTRLKKLRLDWGYKAPAPTAEQAQELVDTLAARAVDTQVTLPGSNEALKPRAPGAKRASNPALEERIHADPDDEQGYLVYADWLQAEGDPLGELIMLDHKLARAKGKQKAVLTEERRAHFVRHQARFLGEARDRDWNTWRLGFIQEATSLTYEDEVKKLVAAPCARFLTRLGMYVLHGTKVLDALIEAKPAPPLRSLELEQYSDALDASMVWRCFPDLRELVVKGKITLGALDLPELRSFTHRYFIEAPAMASIASAKWPKLETLLLGSPETLAELAPVLEGRGLPALRRLALGDSEVDELCVALAQARVVDQLEELDLTTSGKIGPAGAAALVKAKTRFRRLKRFDFQIGKVEASQKTALTALRKK